MKKISLSLVCMLCLVGGIVPEASAMNRFTNMLKRTPKTIEDTGSHINGTTPPHVVPNVIPNTAPEVVPPKISVMDNYSLSPGSPRKPTPEENFIVGDKQGLSWNEDDFLKQSVVPPARLLPATSFLERGKSLTLDHNSSRDRALSTPVSIPTATRIDLLDGHGDPTLGQPPSKLAADANAANAAAAHRQGSPTRPESPFFDMQ